MGHGGGLWLLARFWRKSLKPWLVDHLWTPAPSLGPSGGPSPGEISEMSDTAEDPVVGPILKRMQEREAVHTATLERLEQGVS